jgi:predicted dinucleotide-binding enzyme
MSYAIIGFGKIGHALAKAFVRKGIEVSVATAHDPESFAADAAAIGPTIIPKTLAEAVKADIVFLAARFEAHRDVAKALPNRQGKTMSISTSKHWRGPHRWTRPGWRSAGHLRPSNRGRVRGNRRDLYRNGA